MNRKQRRLELKGLNLNKAADALKFLKSIKFVNDKGQLEPLTGGNDPDGKFLTFDEMDNEQLVELAKDAVPKKKAQVRA